MGEARRARLAAIREGRKPEPAVKPTRYYTVTLQLDVDEVARVKAALDRAGVAAPLDTACHRLVLLACEVSEKQAAAKAQQENLVKLADGPLERYVGQRPVAR